MADGFLGFIVSLWSTATSALCGGAETNAAADPVFLAWIKRHNAAGMARLLIVGLGNHGMLATRHSVGMQVLCHLIAKSDDAEWRSDKDCSGMIAHTVTPHPLSISTHAAAAAVHHHKRVQMPPPQLPHVVH